MNKLKKRLQHFIHQEMLPKQYLDTVEKYIKPLAAWLVHQHKQSKPLVMGLNGAQGTGKSTLCHVLAMLLEGEGYNVAILSLDDLYVSQNKRAQLAKNVHPLFKTRGVPGTHDVDLGMQVFEVLMGGESSSEARLLLPRFDKQTDNPMCQNKWQTCAVPADFVLFEGWCLATPAQTVEELEQPINELESTEDSDAVWRGYVNQQLATVYPKLFSFIDVLCFLQAPAFADVYAWRKQQERLIFKKQQKQGMNKAELTRFIQHFERLTTHSLKTMPQLADVVLQLNSNQQIVQIDGMSLVKEALSNEDISS